MKPGRGERRSMEGQMRKEREQEPVPEQVVGNPYYSRRAVLKGRQPVQVGTTLTNEADLQRSVVAAARQFGWRVYHTWSSVHSPAGFPDLVLCKPPWLLFWELKSETGKITESQQLWLDDLAQIVNIECRIIRPTDLEWAYQRLAGDLKSEG